MRTRRVEISYKTIIFTVLFLIGLSLIWYLRNIIILFFVCVILMLALNPTVTRLQKIKIPRFLAIILIYLIILALLIFAFSGIIPILVEQTTGLIKTLPQLIQNVSIFGTSAIDLTSQLKILEPLPGNIANIAVSVLSNLFSTILILIITFYLLLERKNFGKYGNNFFGNQIGNKIIEIIDALEIRLGSWVNAELLLMLIIGVLSYIAYLLLGLSYAVPLAIIAGLLEIVPNFGPVISLIFASIIGLTISPTIALLTIIAGIIVHQLENNFITPKIMKETCDLNPVITIFLLLVGARLGGIVGAILAIPIYMTIEVVIKVLKSR